MRLGNILWFFGKITKKNGVNIENVKTKNIFHPSTANIILLNYFDGG